MTTPALERLAEKVMGCVETTKEPVCDIPAGTYRVERHRISRQERAIDSARQARNEKREPLRGTFA